MAANRIERYMIASTEARSDGLFWSDFVKALQAGVVRVKGTVRVEISEEGEYRLNIALSPYRE